MIIRSSLPARPRRLAEKPKASQPPPPPPPPKPFVTLSWKGGALLAAPVACGIYAGLASGKVAAAAGALAATPGAALLGGLGGAMISQHLFKAKESTTVGAAIGGGLVGGLAGLAGGAYLGAAAGSAWQAAGLGALGLVTAGLFFLNRDQ